LAKLATIHLLSNHIRIEFQEKDELKSTQWEIAKIIPDDKPGDGKIILQYVSNNVKEFIEVEDSTFLDAIQAAYPPFLFVKEPGTVAKSPLLVMAIISGIIICSVVMLYFFAVPWFSGVIANQVPKNWEVNLGEKMFEGMKKSLSIDSTKTVLLDSFFSEMKIQSKYLIQVHFVNEEVVNAFAMPGGHIVVYSGILNKMDNYTQLAGLMGHEFTHIENRHSLQSIFRGFSSYTLISFLLGDLTGIAAILVENANSIQNLSYSRAFELEADHLAYEILTERHMDPNGLTELFQLLKESSASDGNIPKFLSTHPLTDERINAIKKRIETNQREIIHHENLAELFEALKR
jgi:Zn-dependent protease with chaperone function